MIINSKFLKISLISLCSVFALYLLFQCIYGGAYYHGRLGTIRQSVNNYINSEYKFPESQASILTKIKAGSNISERNGYEIFNIKYGATVKDYELKGNMLVIPETDFEVFIISGPRNYSLGLKKTYRRISVEWYQNLVASLKCYEDFDQNKIEPSKNSNMTSEQEK